MYEYITIVFSRVSGEIYSSGTHNTMQDISIFGNFAKEMSQVFDIINIAYDESIYNLLHSLKVDISTNELVEKNSIENILKKVKRLDN